MKVLTQTLYECDNCGKQFFWNQDSRSLTCSFGKGYAGWDHSFTCCSDACADKLDEKPKKQLEKLALERP